MAAPSPGKKQPHKQGRKRMSARIAEDEDYQLRHGKVAGIDVARAPGMTCLRLPPQDEARQAALEGLCGRAGGPGDRGRRRRAARGRRGAGSDGKYL